jgi:hypothetical protein
MSKRMYKAGGRILEDFAWQIFQQTTTLKLCFKGYQLRKLSACGHVTKAMILMMNRTSKVSSVRL